MSNSHLVSIIIPVYNAESYLVETIECAISQDYPNKEIIIVDDGSNDNSLAIAKKYENEWIKVYSQSNTGGSATRNYGLREAKGEYIQFLDADDLMPLDKISIQMGILLENPNCLVGCKWIRFRNNIEETIGIEGPHECLRMNLDPVAWLQKRHTMLLHGWLTPKTLINKAGYWDENIIQNDDGEYFYRVIAQARKVLFTDETIVYYRSGIAGSVSSLKSEKMYQSEYLAALSYKNVIIGLCADEKSKIEAGNFFKRLVFEMYPHNTALVKLCISQKEYNYATIKFPKTGITGVFSMLFGWKAVKLVKYLLRRK